LRQLNTPFGLEHNFTNTVLSWFCGRTSQITGTFEVTIAVKIEIMLSNMQQIEYSVFLPSLWLLIFVTVLIFSDSCKIIHWCVKHHYYVLHLKQRHVIQSKLFLVYSYQNMPAQGMAHTHTHTHTHTKQFGIDKQSYELGFDFIGWTPICLLLITLDPEHSSYCKIQFRLDLPIIWCRLWQFPKHRNPFHDDRTVYGHVKPGLGLMQKLKWLIGLVIL